MTNLDYVIGLIKEFPNAKTTDLKCWLCLTLNGCKCGGIGECPDDKDIVEWLKKEHKEKDND